MGYEDVVHPLERDQGHDIAQATGAEVEEEALSNARLDPDRVVRLFVRGRHRRLPTKEILISSSLSSSIPKKKVFALATEGVGR